MRRILFPALVALLATLLAACSTLGALLTNQVLVSPAQLQSQLDRRFPRDYEKLGGLVQLRVMSPRLRLVPGGRLQLDFDAGIGALGSNPGTPRGHFTISSGLRFDGQAMALMLEAPSVDAVDIPALGGLGRGNIESALNQWLQDYARNEPVYRFDDANRSQLRGREVQSVDVQGNGILVQLQPAAPR